MSIVIRKSHNLGMSITHFVSCEDGLQQVAICRSQIQAALAVLQGPGTPRDGDPGVSDDEQSHHRSSRSQMVATATGSHHAVSQRQEPSPRPYGRECDEAPVMTTVRPTV
ncbi:hypothetical protein PCANC_03013 [Puccinia coronata f. sp. avenae]|uniref:Uncharacterized protein n=1 Tax=Puccinia coronata f. sp. avenae TaxID=200324 RepID=A0A2N5W1D8_9BASI|nr:hypothetical protein PCANC_03013 [Puccinia coronata f. sp. avenae]